MSAGPYYVGSRYEPGGWAVHNNGGPIHGQVVLYAPVREWAERAAEALNGLHASELRAEPIARRTYETALWLTKPPQAGDSVTLRDRDGAEHRFVYQPKEPA